MKRLLDAVLALTGLAIFLPLFIVVSVLIAWFDGLPILFRQRRVGRNGQLFELVKFRTMVAGLSGSRVTAGMDARVTRMGRVLRRFKLDELPQLWNVLKGDMSFIGPRPEVPAFVDFANPTWSAVVKARPGITDLATLVYRNEEELLQGVDDPEAYYREIVLPEKLELNLLFQKNSSAWLSFKLLLWSVRYSLFPTGFDPDRVRRVFTDSLASVSHSPETRDFS